LDLSGISTIPTLEKPKRGRPRVRYALESPKPEFMTYVQIMDLLRQWLGRVPRYPDWRVLIEDGVIPSYPDPSQRMVFETRVRLYRWPEVEAYYRSVLQPIKPARA
jgi:hypothetical protein